MVKGDYFATSGYVFIINNYPIHRFELEHTEKKVFLEEFRFTTREDVYLTKSDMLQALTDTAQRDFSNNDCFCCIIRSTGTEHGICGTDDEPIDINTITSLFTRDKCPSLDGKPKIFVLRHKNSKYQIKLPPLRGFKRPPTSEDIKASSILRHLVIREKDFLVWNRFDDVSSSRYDFFHGHKWLECLSRRMSLRDAIAADMLESTNEDPLFSTLEMNVFFDRNFSHYR